MLQLSPPIGCSRFRVLVLCGALLGLLLVGDRASAQATSYARPKVNPALSKSSSKIKTMLKNGKFAEGEKEAFRNYFVNYAFPQWALQENLPRLQSRLRRDLLIMFQTGRNGGEAHDYLNKLVLDYLGKRLASANVPPGSRVNSMLAVGELNETEAQATAPAVPLPAAIPVLLAAISDANQLDAVKVAAMAGIQRHLDLDGLKDADARRQVAAVLAPVLAEKQPPGERTADGHAWLRGQAADILGRINAAGDGNANAIAMAEMAGDATVPMFGRCAAARALGLLRIPAGASSDAVALAAPLARLVLDATAAERDQLNRRRLKVRIVAALQGLIGPTGSGGVAAAAAGNQQIAAVVAAVRAIFTDLDDRTVDDVQLMSNIAQRRAAIEAALKPPAAP